ncbi:efflux RND transporter permease subunit [Methanococcus voltae]|uniref:Hydrophobe/amphiphile efflux-3 (HAE3) family protein n=2 Tax=Methanococcus voltae TaxID=2188 RepID=A0A8J7USJ1_METVO|nr:MMPL family transporter [Methanococcus voltae]MBP2172350.1 hydrophobe/amphiphile efflux-3 (HAE3) family protein [Methanococcus voltae]MBP2200694.1 hydrophobe/amphiphile efflux-3 (HAE3) family protein [Methanococcus voltae]MCS3921419.1 hydrophobe/amphiphile efflux-3 (HAE3) family protein [Methanococcus voltae PS]
MIEEILKKIARFSEKRPVLVVITILIMTIVMGSIASNIRMETAFEKMLPQDDEAIKTLYEVRDNFGGTDIVTTAIKIVPSESSEKVTDIRDPRVLELIDFLERDISSVEYVTSVSSPTDVFKEKNNGVIPNDIDTVNHIYNQIPKESQGKIFNNDYTMATLYITSDSGSDSIKNTQLITEIENRVKEAPIPPGTKVILTGTPSLRVLVSRLMNESQYITTVVGLLGVFIVLLFYFRNFLSSMMPLAPVILAVIWTGGSMTLLDIPLDFATTAIASLLLGLGIDYGIHLMHRYHEERKKGESIEEALETAVINTGTAVLATTATTTVGFGALILAPLPTMQNLGKSCSLGIIYCMLAVIILLPSLIVLNDKYIEPFNKKLISKIKFLKRE